MFTFLGAMPSIIHSAFGDKPGIFGTVFALNASGLVIGSLLSRKLLQYMEPHQLLHRLVLYIGAVTAVLVLTGLVWPYAIIAFLVVQFLVSIGISMAQASGIALAMGGDRRRAGSIAALFGAGAFTVGALFSSIANALFDGSVSALAVIIAVCQVAMIVFLLTAENQRRRELAL
jgi:DHA1 family bicyclomycin/chloramphenicol resistance-like MFS transporter